MFYLIYAQKNNNFEIILAHASDRFILFLNLALMYSL